MGTEYEAALLEQSPDALLLLTADGTVTFANSAAERLFGYPREQLLDTQHQYLLADDEHATFIRVFGRLGRMEHPVSRAFSVVGRHRDGRELPLEVSCSLVRTDQGTSLAVAARDATDRDEPDAGRRFAVSLLDATMETVSDGIVVISRDGQITGINDQYLKLWSMPTELLAAKDPSALVRFIADQLVDPGSFLEHVAALYADEVTLSHGVLEFTDGRAVEFNSRPQKTAGTVVGRIWNFRDITPHRQAQNQARVAMEELAEQTDRFKRLAFQDPLTGLANRLFFKERADAALLTQEPVHVLLLDLDDFKEVNDVLGHHAGDEMLIEIARRLQDCVGPHGTVARLGGDEFVVLLVGCRDADSVARRVVDILNRAVLIDGLLLRPGLSLGVATRSECTISSAELLRHADLAMYAAKEAGKNRYVHFQPEMHASLLARTRLTAGLRRSVELGQIAVHYQPVVSAAGREVFQFEALVRWNWQGELVAPDNFITTAERSGMIREIGAEVLRRTCLELGPWLADNPLRSVAVNVSGVQLERRDFAEQVTAIIESTGLDPRQLVLEVTESVFFDAHSHVIAQLETLRESGIRVALDDFGTGYSSLGRLQELPVDIVKIDKSFVSMVVTGAEKLPILTSMIHMAKSLGLKVTAEGIETPAQARFLMDHHCDALQGFLFSRPRPAADRESSLQNSAAGLAVVADAVLADAVLADAVRADAADTAAADAAAIAAGLLPRP